MFCSRTSICVCVLVHISLNMSTQTHAAVTAATAAAASSSSSPPPPPPPPPIKRHEEEEESREITLPEIRTTAIKPTVRAVTKQLQLSPPIGPQSKQLAVVPRAFQHCHGEREQEQEQQQYGYVLYPPPLATHEELVQNRDLFFSTLTKFHVTLGTRLTIPKIGGKDLDLQTLYREVTARGGLQMVINERKWKEITVVLDFPRTTTSASFVLRKYYTNLLHHYEQVHFFRVQGPLVPPPVPPPNLNLSINQTIESSCTHPALADPEIEIKRRKIDSAQVLGVDPASSIGTIVTGSIDGKCEHAYLVTVMVGTRKMRGVLYHVPPVSMPQGASVSAFMNTLGTDHRTAVTHRIGCKRRRKEMSKKDPNAPRQNRTGYNFFFAEQRAKLKSVQPDKDRAISKMIGDLWNRLSEDEKSPYQERGLEDKKRYKREMHEYKERLRLQTQHALGKSDFQNSLHMVQKYDGLSNDTRDPVPFILQELKPHKEKVQHGSENCSDSAALEKQQVQHGSENCSESAALEKHSSTVHDLIENQSCNQPQSSPKDEHPCVGSQDSIENQPCDQIQSPPQGEHPHVNTEEQSVHGDNPSQLNI